MDKLNILINTLEDLKVKDLAVYDFENESPFYQYFIIATVNERQGSAATNYVKKALIADEIKNIEGKGGSWTLIDCHEVIIHLFKEEDRKFYGFDQRLLGTKRIK